MLQYFYYGCAKGMLHLADFSKPNNNYFLIEIKMDSHNIRKRLLKICIIAIEVHVCK